MNRLGLLGIDSHSAGSDGAVADAGRESEN
jgi:hypothetical protein